MSRMIGAMQRVGWLAPTALAAALVFGMAFGLGGSVAPAGAVPLTDVVFDAGDVSLPDAEDLTFDAVKAEIENYINTAAPAIRLRVPKFVDLGALVVDDAEVVISTVTKTVSIAGPVILAGETIEMSFELDWDDDSLPPDDHPTVTVTADYSVSLGVSVELSIGDAIGIINDFTGFEFDAAGHSPDTGLTEAGFTFVYDSDTEAASLDLQGGFRIDMEPDDLVIEVLLSMTDPAGTGAGKEPSLLTGLKLTDADLFDDTITLKQVFRGVPDLAAIAGEIELPEVTMSMVTPESSVVKKNCGADTACTPLRERQIAFFGSLANKLPDDFAPGNTLSLAAALRLDSLGPEVRQAFGYAENESLLLTGELGFDVTDLTEAELNLVDVTLLADLPDLAPDDQALLPDWVRLSDATLKIEYDDDNEILTTEFAATAAVSVPDQGINLSVDVEAQLSLENDVMTIAILAEPSAANGGWDNIFGIEWLDVTSLGFEVRIIAAEGADVDVSGAISSSFEIGGNPFSVRVELDLLPELAAVVTVSFDGQVSIYDVLDQVGIDTATLPSDLDLSLGPVSVTARIGTGPLQLSIGAAGSFPFLGPGAAEYLFSIHGDDVLFGVRSGDATTSLDFVTGLMGGQNPFALTDLPTLGIVGTNAAAGFEENSFNLSPEEDRFFRAFHDCAPAPADCAGYTVDLDQGIHALASFQLPDALDGIRDLLPALWIDPSSGLLLDLSAPFPGTGGALSFSPLRIRAVLPAIVPPVPATEAEAAVQGYPDWFERGRLAFEVTLPAPGAGDPSFAIVGELSIRLRDASVDPSPSPTKPASCIRSWEPTIPGFADHACYDLLDFQISAGVELAVPPKLVLKGALLTEPGVGWPKPFGLDFLRIDAAKIQLGLAPTLSGGLSVDLGFLAAGALFDKDFSGSIAMGMIVQSIPAPPFVSVVPTFNGVRFSSQAGIELADFIDLYDYVAATAEDLGLPAIAPDLSALPNISLRNLDLMVGFASYPDLCIEPGIKLGGTLHINAEPLTVAPPNAPGGCNPGLPAAADPDACTPSNDCFASALLVATVDDGIIVSGELGAFDIGVVNCDQAALDFRLTPSIQVLKVSGGCEVPGVLAGTIDFYVGLDGVAFRGDVQLFPDIGEGAFRAAIEGQAAADLGQVDLSDPATLFALDFDLHAVLSTDFTGLVEEALAPLIENLRLTADAIDAVYAQLQANGGDVLAVVLALPDTIEQVGGDVPQWLLDFADAVEDFRDTLEVYGLSVPNIDDVLGGFDVTITEGVFGYYEPPTRECQTDLPNPFGADIATGIRGTVIDGVCWDDPPGGFLGTQELGTFVDPSCRSALDLPGVVIDGICWAIPPIDVHIPGLHDLTFGAVPATFNELTADIEAIFAAILEPIPGVPNNLTLSDLLDSLADALDSAGSPVDFDCVDFRQDSVEGSSGSTMALRAAVQLFGSDIDLALDWDFSAAPVPQAAQLFDEVVATIFGASDDVECEELGTTTLAAGSGAPTAAGGGDPVQPSLTGFAVAVPATIAEGAQLTLVGTFNIAVPSATSVTVNWGDGSALQTLTVPAGDAQFAPTHTYVDDDPTGTSSDIRNIVVTAIGKSEHATVSVTNVAPAALTGSVSASVEGGVATLSGTFTDPGTADGHTLRVTWGDGTAQQTVAIAGRAFALTHVYADDNPTGTSTDQYAVSVQLTDDDGGAISGSASARVDNAAPSAVTLTPRDAAVTEGSFIVYDLSFVDPGIRDTHVVTIDWGDETPLQTLNLGAGFGVTAPLPVGHRYVDDNPTNTPSDIMDIVVTVRDDDTGTSGAVTLEQTVLDVAPVVQLQVVDTLVEEGDTVSVVGSITDPGVLDTFILTLDWGNDSLSDTVLSLPAGTYDFSAELAYGDDGTFTLGAVVTDDDTLSDSSDPAALVVENVDPTTAIDESGAMAPPPPSGIATFIVRTGAPLALAASASDPGSDDLRFEWDFDTRSPGQLDTGTAITTSLVNPPLADADPSPTVQPRVGIGSSVSHTWARPCVYQVGVAVADDDAGVATDSTWVVVTGTERTVRNSGWWYNAYGDNRKPVFSATTLDCYRQVVNHLSSVFGPSGSGDFRTVDSIAALRDVLNTKQTADANELLIRPLATTWLNLANGALTWEQMVDTDGTGGADTPLWQVLTTAENVRNNPLSTRAQLLAQQAILERI